MTVIKNPSGSLSFHRSNELGDIAINLAVPGNATGEPYSASNPLPLASNGSKDTASVYRVAASATVVTLLAANTSRRRVIIYNESTASLRIKLGSAASATDYTYRLGAGDTYESPTDWVYTGIVTGIWDSATGAAQVTEI